MMWSLLGCGRPPPRGPGDHLPTTNALSLPTLSWGIRAEGGLRILVIPDDAVGEVELAVRVAAGAMDDPAGREGLAHVVEHLVFERRAEAGLPTIGERLRAIATSYNGTTTLDSTHYHATATPAEAPAVAAVLAEIAAGVTCDQLDPADLERVRAAVHAERRDRLDDDDERLPGAILAVGYPAGHPYRRSTIGTPASIDAITWDDVCGFLAERYRPDGVFAVLTGPLSREAAFALSTAFDPITASAPPTVRPVPPPDLAAAPLEVASERSVDLVHLVWPLPARHDEDGLVASIVFERLAAELSELARSGELGEVEVALAGGERAPLVVISVELDGDTPAAVEATVVRIATGLWADVDDQATSYLRAVAVRSLYGRVAAVTRRTDAWADYLQFDASLGLLSSDLERLGTIRRETLVRVTREVFLARRPGVVIARADDPRPSTIAGPRTVGSIEDRSPSPAASSVPPPPQARPRVRTLTLANGLRVVLVPSSHVPIVEARLTIPVGRRDEPVGGAALLSAYAMRPATGGGGRYGHAADLLYSGLAGLGISVGLATTTFTVSTLSPFQDELVWGLADLMTRGVTDEPRRQRWSQRLGARQEGGRDDEIRAEVRRGLYGARAGDVPAMTADSLGKLDRAALDRFRNEHYRPDQAVLVITGDLSWSLLEQHLPVAFAPWTSGSAARTPAAQPATRPRWIADENDEAVVELAVYVPVAVGDAQAEARARVAAAALDERVAEIRGRLGAAYLAAAALDDEPMGASLDLVAKVDPAQAGPAAAIMATALAELRAGTLPPALIARARGRAIRLLHHRMAGDDFDDDVSDWMRRGLPVDHGAAVAAAIAELPDDPLAFATTVSAGQVGVVRGPAPGVTAALAAFGATADVTLDDSP